MMSPLTGIAKGLRNKPTRTLAIIALGASLAACNDSDKKTESSSASFSVMEITIADLHSALEEGEVTCREVVQTYLDRIDAYDKKTGVNALIRTNPDALALADALDQRIAAKDPTLGDMYCVPIIVKDNYDTFDMPTSGGNLALANSVPPDDSYVVGALRAADAIMLAKSNLDEFAFRAAHTISSNGGVTRNAYDLSRTPAGSSGGTASAVAANFATIGLGSDTGNSIRGPSSHAALVGLRSTMGLVSRDGVIPLNLDRDIVGGMTRTVEDTARVLNVIAGYDQADPITDLSNSVVIPDYTQALKKDGLKGAKFGIFRELIGPNPAPDPDVVAAFDKAVADLKKLGAEVIEFEVENYNTEMRKANSCSRFHYDVNTYLASLGPDAPYKTLTEILDSKLFSSVHASNFNSNTRVGPYLPSEFPTPCLGPAGSIADNPGRVEFRNFMVSSMQAHDVDALIYPTWDNAAQPLGDNLSVVPSNVGDNSQGLSPASGQPAITVPMGFDRDGLPLGLQIFGYPFAEYDLIKYAYAYEQGTQHRKPPALFPELK